MPDTDAPTHPNAARSPAVEEAEAEKIRAETRKALADAASAELTLEKARRADEEDLAGNRYHQVLTFNGAVSQTTVETAIKQLTIWMRTKPKCAIEIIFTSPGGDVIDGMALFDFIQHLRAVGHHVTTTTLGMAASMAGILLQAGNVRAMGKEAWVLIHEASFQAHGKVGEVEDTVAWVKRIQERIIDIFAARSKLTKAEIRRRWKRTDWWLSSDDCLRLGLVDEVR